MIAVLLQRTVCGRLPLSRKRQVTSVDQRCGIGEIKTEFSNVEGVQFHFYSYTQANIRHSIIKMHSRFLYVLVLDWRTGGTTFVCKSIH